MNSSSRERAGLTSRYRAALREQIEGADKAREGAARSLGVEAVSFGLDTLDLIRIHQRALRELLPAEPGTGNHDGRIRRAARFFGMALAPIGTAQRTALKARARVSRREAPPGRRDAQLSAVRLSLKREVARRKAVEQSLRTTERHHRQLLTTSHRMQEHLRRLSREVLAAHEEERRKISRELHDQIGQSLTAVNVTLAALKKEATVSTASVKRRITGTQRLLDRSMRLVHEFALELRPSVLDDLGLIPALTAFSRIFSKRTKLAVHITASAACEQLDADKKLVIYRVVQEALTNVAKHAEAGKVDLAVRVDEGVASVRVRDDGKSFAVDRVMHAKEITRLGILGMRERVEMVGGQFFIESARGTGTTVRAEIPVLDKVRRRSPRRASSP